MSKAQEEHAIDGWSESRSIPHPALILERQLTNTLELLWHLQQSRIWSNDATPVKIQRLFDGMSSDLQIFGEMMRNRLESLCCEPHFTNGQPEADWHAFPSDNLNLREQLEALLSGYARYARQTSKAIATLRRRDELECRKLLETMFVAADRHMYFLEMYLDGLALNTTAMRLPNFPDGYDIRNHAGG